MIRLKEVPNDYLKITVNKLKMKKKSGIYVPSYIHSDHFTNAYEFSGMV